MYITERPNLDEPRESVKELYRYDVLDHGFVKLLNIAGPTRRQYEDFDADDTDPANVARMSFGRMNSNRTREQDLRLCEYLIKHKHSSPLETIEIWLEIKLPISVQRQLIRHRIASFNEISGRYVTLPREFYIPSIIGGKPINNKQGRTDNLSVEIQEKFKDTLRRQCESSYNLYLEAISEGVANEDARNLLHLNHYTHVSMKMNLRSLMNMLSLRDHSHAQYSIRVYAQAIDMLVRDELPELMKLYDKYVKEHQDDQIDIYMKKLEVQVRKLVSFFRGI